MYFRMAARIPFEIMDGVNSEVLNAYEKTYIDLCNMLVLLQHYVPLLWDQLQAGGVTWAQYLPVADMLHERLEEVCSYLSLLYSKGTRGDYNDTLDGYEEVRIKTDRNTPLPPTFSDWMRLQLEMGRHPPPVPIDMLGLIYKDRGIYLPESVLGRVQQFSQGLVVMCTATRESMYNVGRLPMGHHVAALLVKPLPMSDTHNPDSLYMANQLRDLLKDVRCYSREGL
jgi:hypothetical protein